MTMPRTQARMCFALLTLVLHGSPEARAADQPDHFADTTSVVVVELPVRVLLDGQPVAGLGPESFEVFDRGHRRELSGFEILDTRPPAVPDGHGQAIAESRPTLHRNWLFLFDLAYADGLSLSKALAASRSMLAGELRPQDTVSVAFFSALRGLKLLAEPATGMIAAQQGLDLMEAVLTRDSGRTEALASKRSPPPAHRAALLATEAELLAEAGILVRTDPDWPHRSVIRHFARSLAALTASLSTLPGQRTVILLSHGFDPLYLTGRGSVGTLHELERTFKACRRTGWVIQAINAGGLRAPAGRDTLFYLAHETGGESFENFNDLGEALDLMVHRGSITYLLSFQVDDVEADGTFHRLKVKIPSLSRRAQVIHRPGYYAPDTDERADN